MNTEQITITILTGFIIFMTITLVIANKSSNNLIKDQIKALFDQRELITKLNNVNDSNLSLIEAQNNFIAVSKKSINTLSGTIDKYENIITNVKVQSVTNQTQVWETFKKSHLEIERLKEAFPKDSAILELLEKMFNEHISIMLPEDKRDFSIENPYKDMII